MAKFDAHIHIGPRRIECAADLPAVLNLDEARAASLEDALNDALSQVLDEYVSN